MFANNREDMQPTETLPLLERILGSEFGSFGFITALMLAILGIVYFVTKHVTHIRSNHSALNDRVGRIDSNINTIRDDLAFLKGSIEIIKSVDLKELFQRKSPVTLTEAGQQVAKELGAEEIISRTWDKIYSILENEISDKNAYDIQQYCMEKVSVDPQRFLDKQGIDRVKKHAFDNGVPLQLYLRVIGLLIRDKYFKKKDIDPKEVDDHDPNIT